MITDEQFNDWAQSSTRKPVFLVEITHKDGVVYLSDSFYATEASETPAHVSYDVCLKESVIVERTLEQDSVGAIRVFNDGSLNTWLDFAWVGFDIEIYVGDKSWARSDFRKQYKSTIASFQQLSATSFEFISTITPSVVQSDVYNPSSPISFRQPILAGNHTSTPAVYIGNFYGLKLYRIAKGDQFNRDDVTITYNGAADTITWVGEPDYPDNTFYCTINTIVVGDVRFACPAFTQDFKTLFSSVCVEVGQAYNADNLADYPFNPDVTFHTSAIMTFPEFLALTLETLGALLWVNDEGEIEFYRKEIPSEVSVNTVTSWVTPNDKPLIQTITTEDPASVVQVKNPDYNHNSEDGPTYSEYNALDLTFPFRALTTHSYAEDSYAIAEARRLADLLSITRRTYSVSVDRITPELFIGAIVNIYSPKDRWNNGSEGLNALVVGITQSFKSNKSELIVWR
jgi:hypothetical protein